MFAYSYSVIRMWVNMSKNLSKTSAFLRLPQVNLISQAKACLTGMFVPFWTFQAVGTRWSGWSSEAKWRGEVQGETQHSWNLEAVYKCVNIKGGRRRQETLIVKRAWVKYVLVGMDVFLCKLTTNNIINLYFYYPIYLCIWMPEVNLVGVSSSTLWVAEGLPGLLSHVPTPTLAFKGLF